MANKLKYMFLSLVRNKISFLFLIIQFASSFILLNMAMEINTYLKNEGKKIELLFENNEIYGLINATERGVNLNFNNDELNKFYEELRNLENGKFVSFHTTELPLYGSKVLSINNEYYHGTELAIDNKVAVADYVDVIKFDESLLEYMDFEISEGELFKKENLYIEDYVPIVLGNNFKEKHQIGDVFYAENSTSFNEELNMNNAIKLKVIGILESGIEVPLISIRNSGEFQNIDNFVMIPYFVDDVFEIEVIENNYNMETLESITTGTIFVEKGKEPRDVLESLNETQELINFDLLNIKERFNTKIKLLEMKKNAYSTISVLIIVFSTIGTVMILLSIVKRNLKEYSIHLLSGASIGDISKIILSQIVFVVVFSLILTMICISTISIYSTDIVYEFKFINIVIGIIIILISWIIPREYIKKMGIIRIMKGEY
ncbi:MAG: hypothetical protein ACRDDL_03255 [Sarcina sp.]